MAKLPSYSRLTPDQRLEKAHGALRALEEDPDIMAAMGLYGYTPEGTLLAEGQALYQAAADGFEDQSEGQGDKLEESADLRDAYAAAYDAYGRLAAVARATFRKDPETLAALGIPRYPTDYVERLNRFRRLSAGARDPERLPRFARHQVTAADFDAFDALVEAFDTALHDATDARADAQQGTGTRNTAIDALDEWMLEMHEIAREALKGKPQLMEKLGITVRS